MEEVLKLWKFYWGCGRSGSLSGLFVATQSRIDHIIGERLYFGEVLGKHSEIAGELEESDLTFITDDQEFIKRALELNCAFIGYDPSDYVESEEEI